MAVQVTSLISYYNIADTLGKRQREVLLALKKIQPANNLMIARYLNLPINSICGRMKELREKGIIIFDSIKSCPITKESTKYYKIKSYISEVME